MKKNIVNILKSIVFMIVFVFLFLNVSSVLSLSESSITHFYDYEEDSIDVVYVGSSNAFAHYNTILAYEEYGITSSLLSTNKQPFSAIEYLIKESERTQNPKVYVIDIAMINRDMKDKEEFTEARIRSVTDAMKFSKNRYDAINYMTKYTPIEEDNRMSMYFSFIKYHSSWKDAYRKIKSPTTSEIFQGHLLNEATATATNPMTKQTWNFNLEGELREDNREVLDNLLAYIDQENLNVLFVIPTKNYGEVDMQSMNAASNYLESRNKKVINFNSYVDDIGIDYATDFYDAAHLNVQGSTKYTLYFGAYLKDNYNLEDHRNKKNSKSWDEAYETYKAKYKEYTKENYEILLESIKK